MTHWRSHDTRRDVWAGPTPTQRIYRALDGAFPLIGGFVLALLFFAWIG